MQYDKLTLPNISHMNRRRSRHEVFGHRILEYGLMFATVTALQANKLVNTVQSSAQGHGRQQGGAGGGECPPWNLKMMTSYAVLL